MVGRLFPNFWKKYCQWRYASLLKYTFTIGSISHFGNGRRSSWQLCSATGGSLYIIQGILPPISRKIRPQLLLSDKYWQWEGCRFLGILGLVWFICKLPERLSAIQLLVRGKSPSIPLGLRLTPPMPDRKRSGKISFHITAISRKESKIYAKEK